MKLKAVKCLDAENVDEVIKILNGQKIQAFFNNIYHVEDDKVTIDVWALRVLKFDKNLTPKVYRTAESAYQDVSKEMDILPKQLQAITWTALRD